MAPVAQKRVRRKTGGLALKSKSQIPLAARERLGRKSFVGLKGIRQRRKSLAKPYVPASRAQQVLPKLKSLVEAKVARQRLKSMGALKRKTSAAQAQTLELVELKVA